MPYATREQFLDLCDRVGIADSQASSGWREISIRYSEPHRHYHTLAHIDFMLSAYEDYGEKNDALEMAIWFHDIVYDPASKSNEEDSSAFFQAWAEEDLGENFLDEVSRLIVATDHSRPRSDCETEALLVDLDLLIFSTNRDSYQRYAQQVREEYSSVPEEVFNKGRIAVMQNFLNYRIYRSPGYRNRERYAHENIINEILELLEK